MTRHRVFWFAGGRPRPSWPVLALTAWLCGLSGSQAVAQGQDGRSLPVVTVPAGVAAESAGRTLAAQALTLFPDLPAAYDAILARRLDQEQFDAWAAAFDAAGVTMSADVRAELSGLALGLGAVARDRLGDGALSLAELWAIQLWAGPGAQPGGFAVARDTQAGAVFAARDLGAFAGYMTVTVRENDWVGIAPAAMVGALAGLSAQGAAGAAVAAPQDGIAAPWTSAQALAVRVALEQGAAPLANGRAAVPAAGAYSVLIRQRVGWSVVEIAPDAAPVLRRAPPEGAAVTGCFAVNAQGRRCTVRSEVVRRLDLEAGLAGIASEAGPAAIAQLLDSQSAAVPPGLRVVTDAAQGQIYAGLGDAPLHLVAVTGAALPPPPDPQRRLLRALAWISGGVAGLAVLAHMLVGRKPALRRWTAAG